MSKSDLTAIDLKSKDIRDVKYLPPSYDGNVIFILPPINVDVFSIYGRFMDVRQTSLIQNKNNKYLK